MSPAALSDGEKSMTAANNLAVRPALELAGVEFIDENGGGPGVRLRKGPQKKTRSAQFRLVSRRPQESPWDYAASTSTNFLATSHFINSASVGPLSSFRLDQSNIVKFSKQTPFMF
jgi:hypothetical protein